MIWIVLTIIFALVGTTALVVAFLDAEDRFIWLGITGASVLGFVILTAVSVIAAVPAGNIGLVYQFGSIVGQRSEGVSFIAPWQSVTSANIQVQRYTFTKLGAASHETQDVNIDVTLNYQVDKGAIQGLYRNVGKNYFDVLVQGRMRQILKDETVKYGAIEITQKRDEIRDTIANRLKAELTPYSISVVNLTLDHIAYSDQFTAAIEAKQTAVQNALREQEVIKASEAQASQAKAVAIGKADALREEARGQADANKLLTDSLSPALIQYQSVQKLAPNIQIALIPSGQGLIIDPATLLAPKK